MDTQKDLIICAKINTSSKKGITIVLVSFLQKKENFQ